ncbi:unnamed protein product [Cuscuta europaea]|uniref:RIN4 pathogenic type III effector avirulence factor Avr cleavage site domain-containing protein n=1 Tax=Cuscuta europaea TaxID=41803 RepID=A0A9P0ZB91_CUSEU|nr:unnamed protein product [Cuscuta europaea]
MDSYDCDYFMKRSHVPPFGSWDCDGDFPIPFTQCFESARQAGLLRYSYSEDRDLYVTGDLYENDVVTPTMIVVPRRRGKGGKSGGKKEAWTVDGCDYDCGVVVKTPPSPVPPSPPSKAVDEDLYQISPDLLYASTKRKRSWGFFSSCLRPVCL